MIESKLKRELNHHYLVIQAKEETSYELQMLLHNKMQGVLKFKLHIADNENEYYYEITDQKSLIEIYDKKSMNFIDIKNVILNIISSVETGEEYMLNPNSFVLSPEYIYISNDQSKVNLCYLPSYNNGIKEQLSTLIEYLMNKINHMDEKAVVLIYGLYKISREENCTFKNLKQFIKAQEYHPKSTQSNESYSNESQAINQEEILVNKNNLKKDAMIFEQKGFDKKSSKIMPFMENKIQSEAEIRIYPLYIKISAFFTCFFSCSIIIVLIKSEMFINKTTNEVDITKAIGIFAVLFSIAGYICSRLFSKENKRSKMIQIVEYQDVTQKDLPRNNLSHNYSADSSLTNNIKENNIKEFVEKELEDTIDATCLLTLPETLEEKTIILNQVKQKYPTLQLISLEPKKYDDLSITKFPCRLGTNKELSDYIINNKAISRCHIKIERNEVYNEESIQDIEFLIFDLSSTNGTKINNQILNQETSYKVEEEDIISIADYQYQVNISINN